MSLVNGVIRSADSFENINDEQGFGLLTKGSTIRICTESSPLSNSIGNIGEIRWDSNYLYICTSTNTWKRIELQSY